MQKTKWRTAINRILILVSLFGTTFTGWTAGHIMRQFIPGEWHPALPEGHPPINPPTTPKEKIGQHPILTFVTQDHKNRMKTNKPLGYKDNLYLLSNPAKCIQARAMGIITLPNPPVRRQTVPQKQGVIMAKTITAEERIKKARQLIQKARELPVPDGMLGKSDLSYIAGVKDLLRQARDLVKFIPQRAGVTAEMKAEAQKVIAETKQANTEILHG
ncbi:MAG: hypothetical protein Kow002_21540 [Anaerolineales bacterium]